MLVINYELHIGSRYYCGNLDKKTNVDSYLRI